MKFTKMSGAGNDFVLLEKRDIPARWRSLKALAKTVCDRRKSIGADGLLVLERGRAGKLPALDYYNADGSRAFCGNGSRCAAAWMHAEGWQKRSRFSFSTIEGVLDAEIIRSGRVRVKMPPAHGLRLQIAVPAAGKTWTVNSINTGVPHAVIVVKDVEKAPVVEAGRAIRHHLKFAPAGTNVNFIEFAKGAIKIRTYERGVEDETLACGSGVTASALCAHRLNGLRSPVRVIARSGDLLTVSFRERGGIFDDIWLEGPALATFKGEIGI